MKDAYVMGKWKLFGVMIATALFGMVVGRELRR